MPRNKNKFKTAVDTVIAEEIPVLIEDASTATIHSKPSAALRPRSRSKRKELALAKLQQRQQQQQAVGTGTQGDTGFGSNWQSLKQKLTGHVKKPFRRREVLPITQPLDARPVQGLDPIGPEAGLTEILALDCEMVGTGPRGATSELARVSVVNDSGVVVLDLFVKPVSRVTDYRTRYSGVRARDLVGAPSAEEVRPRVARMLAGRLLVGHALHNDLKALDLQHPDKLTRDTARFPPLMKAHPAEGTRPQARRLRDLAKEVLGLVIQKSEHSPIDDARASLYLYHRHAKEWEAALAAKRMHLLPVPVFEGRSQDGKANGQSLVELAAKDDMVDL